MRAPHRWIAFVAMTGAIVFFAPPAFGVLSTAESCRDAVALATRRAATLTINARSDCVQKKLNHRLGAGIDCMANPAALGGAGSGDAKTDEALAGLLKHRDRQGKRIETACAGLSLAQVGVADVCSPPATEPSDLAECAVLELGKPAGDSLSALLDLPRPASRPGGGARKCFDVIDRGLRFNVLKLNGLAGDCFTEAEDTATSAAGCLATVAPPGIVATTGFPAIDDQLALRLTRFRGTVIDFCVGVNLVALGFPSTITDPTTAPLTLEDLFGELYDALLATVTGLNAAVYPAVAFCGDGATGSGEQCDDGNRDSCDGCDRDCSLAGCGNGASCGAELCDDGNVASGDGCDAACISEFCGNGVVQPANGEACDDGAANSNTVPNACRKTCALPSCGDGVIDTGETCDPPVVGVCEPNCTSPNCGDGVVDPGEECDDGPANSDVAPNACRTDCTDPSCGDGVTDAGETCDAGGNSASCDANCTLAACGDGFSNPAAGETCDDGGLADGDGCDSNCTITGCGNGIATPPENCDDGNTSAGDGCSAVCTCGPGSGETGPCGSQDPECPGSTHLVLFAGTRGVTCANNGDCGGFGVCDTALGRCTTVSELDTGWSGIAHDADIVDEAATLVSLVCPGPAPVCGECAIAGLDASPGYCRCASDNRAICDQPFVADADDCGGGTCNCYFGVPLPLSSGNTPACVLNRFRQNVTGTVDVDSGAGESVVRLASVVYLGASTIEPCPSCGGKCTAPASNVGDSCAVDLHCDTTTGSGDGVCGNYDPTPNDGVRGGTCRSGVNDGQTCDAGSRHESFPAPGGAAHSLDCFPIPGLNVSGSGLRIDLDQSTGTSTLTAAVDCGPANLYDCHCAQCTGNSQVPCASNADCAAVSAGTCAKVATLVPFINQCASDNICNNAGGGEGVCNLGPTDKFCDGITRANGEGFIACTGQGDCDVFPGGIAGSCSLNKIRECFLSSIVAPGVADPEFPVGAATFCIGQTSNGGINAVAGLPGPGRVVNQGAVTFFCASNPAVVYTPGAGGCP
jgi:cysteine-rich repeat protein